MFLNIPRPKLIGVLILLVAFPLVLFSVLVLSGKNMPFPTKSVPNISGWETYNFGDILFQYPAQFQPQPQQVFGGGSEVRFLIDGTTEGEALTLNVYTNYNQVTGKPFAALDEICLPACRGEILKTKVDGEEAIDMGSSAYFFSKDRSVYYDLTVNSASPVMFKGKELTDTHDVLLAILSTVKLSAKGSTEGPGEIWLDSVSYGKDCSVVVTLMDGRTHAFPIDQIVNQPGKIKDCQQTFAPQVSLSSPGYAFPGAAVIEVWQEPAQNALYAYSLLPWEIYGDGDPRGENWGFWVRIDEIAAANVEDMRFDEEGTLLVTERNDESALQKRIMLPELWARFDEVVDQKTREIVFSDSFKGTDFDQYYEYHQKTIPINY